MENFRANMMRLIISLLLCCLFSAVSAAPQQLPGLQPLPPPPPLDANTNDSDVMPSQPSPSLPPAVQFAFPIDDSALDITLSPEVTTIKQTEQTVEEYRISGRLYMIKITPKHGVPYYLIDDIGDGNFSHHQNLGPGFRPPRWVIYRF